MLKKTCRFSLRHIRDDAVRDDEENKVLRSIGKLSRDVGHVIDCRGKVCRSVKLNSSEAAFVSSQYT